MNDLWQSILNAVGYTGSVDTPSSSPPASAGNSNAAPTNGETFTQAWKIFFTENPITEAMQEFGVVGTNSDGTPNYSQGGLLSGFDSSSLTIWLVLGIILLVLIAYIVRETVG